MNTEVDLKALWNKQEAKDIPETKELFKKAGRLRRLARIRLIVQTVGLLAVVAIILCVGLNINHKESTTIIGLILMVAGIVSYLIALNQLLPMLFKSDMECSAKEYLNQLIRIKRKLEFLDKIMVDIYFGLLLAGVLLFGWQFTGRMSTAWEVCYYVILIGSLTAAWIYSKTQALKNTLKPLNETIKRLEAVNEQLGDSD